LVTNDIEGRVLSASLPRSSCPRWHKEDIDPKGLEE